VAAKIKANILLTAMAEEVASALAQCSDWQVMTRIASKIFFKHE